MYIYVNTNQQCQSQFEAAGKVRKRKRTLGVP